MVLKELETIYKVEITGFIGGEFIKRNKSFKNKQDALNYFEDKKKYASYGNLSDVKYLEIRRTISI